MDNIKTKIYLNSNVLKIELNENIVNIDESCLIKKECDMSKLIHILQNEYTDLNLGLNKMSEEDMILQWKGHNMLCRLLFNNKKCNVIMKSNMNWCEKIFYSIISSFYF